MRCAIELSNVHDVILILQNRRFVVVNVEVIRSTEYGHDTGESCRPGLPIHAIACILCFVGPNNGQEVVLFKKSARGRIREEVGATSNVIVDEVLPSLFLAEFFQRICPEYVAHKAMSGWFAESVDLSL